MLCEASAILVHPNGMKLFGCLHMFKSLGHAKFHLNLHLHVSASSTSLVLAIIVVSTASAIYLHPNELQICRSDNLSK